MRSKLCAATALTPSKAVPLAAQSRELPVPYSCPAITTSSRHDAVVSSPGAITVEVLKRHAVLDEVLAGGCAFLDAAGRRNVVGGHAVAENAQRPRPGNLPYRLRL